MFFYNQVNDRRVGKRAVGSNSHNVVAGEQSQRRDISCQHVVFASSCVFPQMLFCEHLYHIVLFCVGKSKDSFIHGFCREHSVHYMPHHGFSLNLFQYLARKSSRCCTRLHNCVDFHFWYCSTSFCTPRMTYFTSLWVIL